MEDNIKTMRVSILAMLYAVSNMVKKVKGQELTASLFYEFIGIWEDSQRNLANVRHDLKLLEKSLEGQSKTITDLNQENEALLAGNVEIVKTNRELRSLNEELQETLKLRTSERDYWQKSSNDWRQDYNKLLEKV